MLQADVRDPESIGEALDGLDFDAVVDWVAFTPEHVRADIDLFRGRTGQYVFISSASAYQTPPARVPVIESTPLRNPFWSTRATRSPARTCWSQRTGTRASRRRSCGPRTPTTRRLLPFDGGWTVMGRMRQGKGVVVHGDGTSLWTLTHHGDFARGFVRCSGTRARSATPSTSPPTTPPTWNQIAAGAGGRGGVEARSCTCPSDAVAAADPEWGAGLLGDKAHSMVFDNSKLRAVVPDYLATVPFEQGAREIVAWHDEDPEHKVVDARMDALMDRLVEHHHVQG